MDLKVVIDRLSEEQNQRLEMLAAAYIQRTGIDPQEAVLCHRMAYTLDGALVSRWWFERKATAARPGDLLCPGSDAGSDRDPGDPAQA